jgi:hypothetical protein
MRKADFMFHNLLFTLLILMLIIQGREALIFVLIAQFFVGIYQVISTAIRTARFKMLNTKTQLLIKLYWALTVLYLIGYLIVWTYNDTILYGYLLSAWGIALYYHFITYKLAYPKFIKSHLDI